MVRTKSHIVELVDVLDYQLYRSNMNKPYYAVIFSSQRSAIEPSEYEEMANRMVDLAKDQKGFVSIESARGADGFGITVSYWESLEDIKNWKTNSEHLTAQKLGREKWYETFTLRICKVEREYSL